jgi:hypothetical protein
VKERPILFSGPMVRAILAGRKTQTRRVVKFNYAGRVKLGRKQWHINDTNSILACPYGKPGDRLWVREEHYRFGHWEPVPGVQTKGGRQKWKFVADTTELRYNDNAPEAYRKGMHKETPDYRFWHKRLARFMPRIASRITLEITKVRVERLQDITEADARAEGADKLDFGFARPSERGLHKLGFRKIWQSINGPDSWAANPWVWVIEFRRVQP